MNLLAPFSSLPDKTRKNISCSIWEGVFYSVMVGMAESYFGAFGVFLNASSTQLGFLAAFPPFLAALCQMGSLLLLNRFPSRRPILVVFAAMQALMIIPIALLPFALGQDGAAIFPLLAFVALYWGAAGFTSPIWNSLIGDLVPADFRGRYFGVRSRWMGLATMSGVLLAGAVLNLFSKFSGTSEEGSQHPTVAWGYLIIFFLKMIFLKQIHYVIR